MDLTTGDPKDELAPETLSWFKTLGVEYKKLSEVLAAGPEPKVQTNEFRFKTKLRASFFNGVFLSFLFLESRYWLPSMKVLPVPISKQHQMRKKSKNSPFQPPTFQFQPVNLGQHSKSNVMQQRKNMQISSTTSMNRQIQIKIIYLICINRKPHQKILLSLSFSLYINSPQSTIRSCFSFEKKCIEIVCSFFG